MSQTFDVFIVNQKVKITLLFLKSNLSSTYIMFFYEPLIISDNFRGIIAL